MLNASSSSSTDSNSPLSDFVETTFSYNGNVMLLAIISLLLVILFVLLLHLYAKWFLSQARRRSRNPISISHLLPASQFLPFNHGHDHDDVSSLAANKQQGLDASALAALPVFVHKSSLLETDQAQRHPGELECVICLSVFEDDEIGKNLPRCGHAFHVPCVDMWLHSHSTCPICRTPVDSAAFQKKKKVHHREEAEEAAANNRVDQNTADVISAGRSSSSRTGNDGVDPESPATQSTIVIEIREQNHQSVSSAASSSSSSSSSQSQAASMLGYTLKRMLSRNRSEHNKVLTPVPSPCECEQCNPASM